MKKKSIFCFVSHDAINLQFAVSLFALRALLVAFDVMTFQTSNKIPELF